jgi:putative ABC transport system permease protein
MFYASWIWRNLRRNRARTVLAFLSIAAAFGLFGVLVSLSSLLQGEYRFSADNRIFVYSKFGGPLPLSYVERVKAVPGLALDRLNYGSSFKGYYRDPKNEFGMFSASVDTFIASQRVGTRFVFDQEQLENWRNERSGAMISRRIADEFGLSVGDRLSVTAPATRRRDGSDVWEFTIVGVFRYENAAENPFEVWLHYDYLNADRVTNVDTVGYIVNVVDDATQVSRISNEIDDLFRNSSVETQTGTEDLLRREYFKQVGNLTYAIYLIFAGAFLTMMAGVCNSQVQVFQQRLQEIGTLKVIGFGTQRIASLILAESLLLVGTGGVCGLALSAWVVGLGTRHISNLIHLSGGGIILGLSLVLFVSGVVGALGIIVGNRKPLAEALRRSEA